VTHGPHVDVTVDQRRRREDRLAEVALRDNVERVSVVDDGNDALAVAAVKPAENRRPVAVTVRPGRMFYFDGSIRKMRNVPPSVSPM
jgi:hypothetical protein